MKTFIEKRETTNEMIPTASSQLNINETTKAYLNTTNMKATPTTFRGLMLMAIFMVLTTLGYGQTYNVTINNGIQVSSTAYEFDIQVSAVSTPIAFSDFQFGLLLDNTWVNGNNITPSVVTYNGPGTAGSTSWDNNNNIVRISTDVGNSCSTSAFTIGTTPVTVYHIRLTSGGSFPCGDAIHPNIAFNYGNGFGSSSQITTTSPYPTRIAYWASCAPVNDSDITAEGAFNGTLYSITYIGGSSSNLYYGQSPVNTSGTNNSSLITWYADVDGDGYGNPNSILLQCAQPAGYVSNNLDCNDTNAAINPTTVWYLDADSDGYYVTGTATTQCLSPGTGYTYLDAFADSGDCNDTDAAVHPNAGITYPIAGYNSSSQIYLAGNLLSDLVDEDIYIQASTSNDGKYLIVSSSYNSGLNETIINLSASLSTSQTANGFARVEYELCNGIDDNCDGLVDNDLPTTNYFRDNDFDGYGAGMNSIICTSCCINSVCDHYQEVTACTGLAPYANGDGSPQRGWSLDSLDCNDANINIHPTTTTEIVSVCGSYTWNDSTFTANAIDTAYLSGFEGCDSTDILNLTITGPCTATINLTLFPQGYYTDLGMTTPMDNSGYGGCLYLAGISSDPTAVDTITVSLMDSVSQSQVGASIQGILHTDGTMSVNFPGSVIGNSYYIKINHRNALETWSAYTVLINSATNFNFSTSIDQAYGENMVWVDNVAGQDVYALWSGDVASYDIYNNNLPYVQDGAIDGSDYGIMEEDFQSFLFGYYTTDITGDAAVDGSDYGLEEENFQLFLFKATPW